MEEIARAYAEALFESASERDKLDVVREQIGQFADALNENRELSVFFFSPYFSTQEKHQGLSRMLDGAEPEVTNFLELLIEKHRVPVIFKIRRTFDELWAEANKLLPVTVTSAVELHSEIVEQIVKNVEQQTGRTVQLESRVDDAIIGGLIVQVGNMVLDASIRNRLEKIRKQVTAAAA